MPSDHQPATAPVPSANVWVDCACGERHWGRYGAAGLLLVHRPAAGEPEVLLQHRAGWTHHGGTWALPGGARHHDERPDQAALREASEEAGLDPDDVQVGEVVAVDHGTWSYSYVMATIDGRPDLVPSDEETQDLRWVPAGEVGGYPLHPHFAQAWPSLLERVHRPVRNS